MKTYTHTHMSMQFHSCICIHMFIYACTQHSYTVAQLHSCTFTHSHSHTVTLVSQVSRGGGQGQSLISLAICLRCNFGPSGKWVASPLSKGWGRTHIANSSRSRTFKRPGAGVAIRAPRLRRLVNDQCGSEATTLAEVMVQEGVTTCQAAACHADSGAQFAQKLGSANIGFQSVWRLADEEFDAHLAACARVERVARMHTPRVQKPLAMQEVTRTCGPAACGERRAAEAGQGHPAGVKSPRDNEAMVNTAAKF